MNTTTTSTETLKVLREELDADVANGSLTPGRADWYYGQAATAVNRERRAADRVKAR